MTRNAWIRLLAFTTLGALLTLAIPPGGVPGAANVTAAESPASLAPSAERAIFFCPATNDAGCRFSDIACTSYSCCCIYSCAGGGSSTGSCFFTSPF